jgi:methylaspartate mutase epsilon subunit
MLSKFLKPYSGFYLQPRMGVASIVDMAKGIKAVKDLKMPTIGTITLDSYTRLEQFEEAQKALKSGLELNGFPILAYPPEEIIKELSALADKDFLIQVRHGSPNPEKIFNRLVACNLFLTEGGPVSYCLPYSRAPLKEAIYSWKRACATLAQYPEKSHLESFAGCLLGQLCHPSILVSLGILEALFFQKQGIIDLSLSYAQQYNISQDLAAVTALKRLAHLYLAKNIDWHIVIYTFMGLFPQTSQGYERILQESVHLTINSGAKRLIVKTQEESLQIPTLTSNLNALTKAHEFSLTPGEEIRPDEEEVEVIFSQAQSIIDAVLNLDSEIEKGLYEAFQKGILDVPFCLHPDNRRLATCTIDDHGYLQWISIGNLPFSKKNRFINSNARALTSDHFLQMLAYNRQKFD